MNWIDINKELPEGFLNNTSNSKLVLVWVDDNGIKFPHVAYYNPTENSWYNGTETIKGVTHWTEITSPTLESFSTQGNEAKNLAIHYIAYLLADNSKRAIDDSRRYHPTLHKEVIEIVNKNLERAEVLGIKNEYELYIKLLHESSKMGLEL